MAKIKTIAGKTVTGENCRYTFELLDAVAGLTIFHKVLPTFTRVYATIQGHEFSVFDLISALSEVFSIDDVQNLAAEMLKNGKYEINEKTFEMGETGIGEYTEGNPIAVYEALFHAFLANFPKYLSPFLKAAE